MFKLTTLFILSFILSVFYTYTITAQTSLDKNVDCLAEAIYFEARSENFMAQLAVGNVIYNRVKSSKFPNTFCGVVHQANKTKSGRIIKNKCQFSYYCDGKEETIYNGLAYERSVEISYLVLEDVKIDFIEDALYYHAVYVTPYWAKNKKYLGKVGLHKFYK